MPQTAAETALLDIIRRTGFGTIEHLRISGGRPVIDANTEIEHEFKLSGVEQARQAIPDEQYAQKPQVRAMFERFTEIGDGLVEALDVRDGLPFKMTVRTRAK